MANTIEEGFKEIFLAGVGAMAMTGEKAKEVLDQLVEKGGITVEQGKDINTELTHKATETISKVRTETVEQALKFMSPEERSEFAASVASMVEKANAEATEEAVEKVEEA